MSDYMFMLDSHLSSDQNRVVSQVQAVAADANVNLFLTGGAVRDMLGGFAIRDLDFTVEGNASKLAKAVIQATGAKTLAEDDLRKTVELLLPGGVRASIGMSRTERYSKVGVRPQVFPATIHEDLRGRDFSFNAIALSLNRASLGLILDPNNGLADLERREVRAVHSHVFYEDPSRMLRMIRFRVRMGCTIGEKTQGQYDNARMEELERHIPARQLFEELEQIAEESNPGEILQAFDKEKLLPLFCPALGGAKLNLAGFTRLQKARQLIPFGVDLRVNNLSLFLYILTEKLSAKEKAALAKATTMRKSETSLWQKLEPRAKALEKELRSPKLQKASLVYNVLSKASGEDILFLYLRTARRLVQDRIRNFLQKYLPAAQEITERQVIAAGAEPGTPKFRKLREELITARLDGRIRKPAPPPPPEAPPPARPHSPQAQPARGPSRTTARLPKAAPARKSGRAGARR